MILAQAENVVRPPTQRIVPAVEDIVVLVPPAHMPEALELAASSQRVRGVLVLPGGCRSAHFILKQHIQALIVSALPPRVEPSWTLLIASA